MAKIVPGLVLALVLAIAGGILSEWIGIQLMGLPKSPISAIMIMGDDGKPWLAMGTPGNPPQPVTEVLVNIIDFGMDPKAAAEAPRFWSTRGGETLRAESRISEEALETLRRRGFAITDIGPFNFHTGSMQIVWRNGETGMLHGVTDPRRLGYAAGH